MYILIFPVNNSQKKATKNFLNLKYLLFLKTLNFKKKNMLSEHGFGVPLFQTTKRITSIKIELYTVNIRMFLHCKLVVSAKDKNLHF